MEKQSNSLLMKIRTNYLLDVIFDFIQNYNLKYQLLKYNKKLQTKYQLSLLDYQNNYRKKFKYLSFEDLIKNKKEIIQENNINESFFDSIVKTYIHEYINYNLINNSENSFDFISLETNDSLNYFISPDYLFDSLNIILYLKSNLKENQINIYQDIINNVSSVNRRVLISLIKDEKEKKKIDSIIEKIDFYKLKYLNITNLDYNDIKFEKFSNLIELYYTGDLFKKDFNLINSMNYLSHLSIKNNKISEEFEITLENLKYLSLDQCECTFIINSKKIIQNLIYFKINSCEVKFNFIKKNEKIAFPLLEYLFFIDDIVDFEKSQKIKKIKDNSIELHQNTIKYYIQLLENCKNIKEINLDCYNIKKLDIDLFNKFLELFGKLNLKILTLSSSFDETLIKKFLENTNISKNCESIKLFIDDFNFIDFIFTRCNNLRDININLSKKIAKFRINTPKVETIVYLNNKMKEQLKITGKENNWIKIEENYEIKINSIQLNNPCFSLFKNRIYCQNFTTLITLKLINIPINTETLPLFGKNCQINFFNLKNLTIRITNYIDTFYTLEFKRKTFFQICKNNDLKNPFDIDPNFIEKEVLINFSNNLYQVSNLENLVLNFMITDIDTNFVKELVNKILELKHLNNLDFSIVPTHEENPMKINQLCNIFPKLKSNKHLLKKNCKIIFK